MTVRAITIDSVTYNVAQAPALQQKKLMLLIGPIASLRSQQLEKKIVPSIMLGMLTVLPEATFDEVAGIVLYKTVIAGESSTIDIGSFQGKVTNYFKLVAEAIAYNLDDFFTFLASEIPVDATREK